MIIRQSTVDDLMKLKEIHEQFFANEFSFDDFIHASISSFVVLDENDGEIVAGGSIRPIAEMSAVTNLNKSPRLRRTALLDMLQVATFVLRETPMNQLHVFIQSPDWERQLIKSGFRRTKGNALVIDI
jgi:hypothetical protein